MKSSGVLKAFRACVALACMLSMHLITSDPLRADEAIGRSSEVVRDLAEEIWASREFAQPLQRKRVLAEAIEARTNVILLSRLALGKHWRSLAETDRDEYEALFSQVIIGGLADRLHSLLGELDGPLEQHFSITRSIAAGKRDVLVRSRVVGADGQPFAVDWRLRNLEKGPVIIDLVVEGVSLLVTQRAEFAAVIERSGMDGLMAALRRRAQSLDY